MRAGKVLAVHIAVAVVVDAVGTGGVVPLTKEHVFGIRATVVVAVAKAVPVVVPAI